MPGVEQASSKSWLNDENNRILLATLAAAALAAGSTILWRSNLKRVEEPTSVVHSGLHASPGEKHRDDDDMNQQSSQGNSAEAGGSTKQSKSSRSKERRRRGKDVVKEMTKVDNNSLKKTKKQKQHAPKTHDDAVAQTAIVVPKIIEPEVDPEPTSPVSLNECMTTTNSSSGSRSSSLSVAQDSSLLGVTSTAGSDLGLEGDSILFTTTITSSVSAPDAAHEHPGREAIRASQSESVHVPDSDILLSSDTASSSSFPSSSIMASTPSSTMSPSQPFLSEKPRDLSLQPSLSMYPHYTSPSPATRIGPGPNGSWDYDAPESSITYRKPPRFGSKSRGSGTVSPISTSISYIPPYNTSFNPASNPPFLSSSESSSPASTSASASTPESAPNFTFPTLNPSPSPSPSPVSSSSPKPKINTNALYPQRTPTPSSPLRTPTPSQSPIVPSPASPGVTVSAQTQMASLRGALEAARMREEKAKGEAERLGRECQELRWRWSEDVTAWRRREGELQNHIQVLMQHIQGYASILASIPQAAHLQVPYPVLSSANGIQNQTVYSTSGPYSASSTQSSSPAQSQSPSLHSAPHSHPGSPQLQQGLTSPLSPFFTYPSLQLPVPQPSGSHVKQSNGQRHNHNQPHPNQNQNQNAGPSQPQHNLFSLFFPGTGPGAASGSGSVSPVVDGSHFEDRGRRRPKTRGRTRARTKTATQRDQDGVSGDVGGGSGADAVDDSGGTHGNDGGSGDGGGEEDRDEVEAEREAEEGFSDLLADAILKRPESLCGGSFRSGKRGKEKEKERPRVGGSGDKSDVNVKEGDEHGDGWIRDTTISFDGFTSPGVSVGVGDDG